MYKVVLVDDEPIIIGGLQQVIPWADLGCAVIGTATDGLAGLELIRRETPDILFSDIRMPNMDGLSMIAALKSEYPDMQITILTAFRDFEYAQKAIQLGVARYLLKPSKMDELRDAVRAMVDALDARGPREDAAAPAQPGAESVVQGESDASRYVVDAALAYIRENYANRLRLADVAESVFVSQWHLSKLINRHLGKSFFDLLNEQRVEVAKRLLLNPTLKVHEIGEIVGFLDVAHFSKTFKRLTDRTPMEYRNAQLYGG